MNSKKINFKWSKRKIILLSAVFFIIGFCLASIMYFLNSWQGLIYPGVHIKNISIGGMDKRKALEIINLTYIDKIQNKEVALKYDNIYHYLKLSKLGIKTNIEEVLEEAMNYGKNFSIIEKLKILTKPQNIEFDFQVKVDENDFNVAVDDISQEIYKEPIDADLSIKGGNISIIPHEDGISINRNSLKEEVEACIYDLESEELSVEVPTVILQAKITEDMLQGINGVISSFTTNFRTSQEGRVKNIEKGAEIINGTILLPGEVFSFNDTVGDTSKERGFFPAPEILYGKLEEGYGGGMCQVSSTLYGAILRANITPMNRQHHSFPVNYVQEGLDAAIAYGVIDFKFKNIYDIPIYIRSVVNGRNITFSLYSDVSLLKGKMYEYYSINKEIIPAGYVYITDPNLSEGIYETRVKGRDGVICDVYRITYDKSGNILEEKFIYKDTYAPIDAVIAMGSKKR